LINSVDVAIRKLPHGEGLDLPEYQTSGSAGCDLCAAVSDDVLLEPGARALVPTGIAIALPEGYEAQIRPRSGLSIRHGITVINAPGTIDADYRGEISVPMVNLSNAPYTIKRGDRIAQMVIAPYTIAVWRQTTELDTTNERGVEGFGSTGR
jgi:dUTP pyrophosphatase